MLKFLESLATGVIAAALHAYVSLEYIPDTLSGASNSSTQIVNNPRDTHIRDAPRI